MRVNFGPHTWLYPLPVLIVGSYNEDGTPNAMNAAWGGIYDTNQVILCVDFAHKTYQNILSRGAFTVSPATAEHLAACDYVGLESGNQVPNKLEKAGFTTEKSGFVDAPILCQLPVTLECRLVGQTPDGNLIGQILNVSADERILDENGRISPALLQPIVYDSIHHTYRTLGPVAGKAFRDGKQYQ